MASPASSDEGEIRDIVPEKATTSPPQVDGTSVDRQDRTRSRYSSPSISSNGSRDRHSSERSRSPNPDRTRGAKRPREEDQYDRRYTDPRRFKVHYEDRPSDRRRNQLSYDDPDRRTSADLRYNDRDQYYEKSTLARSRSPYRASRGHEMKDQGGLSRRGDRRHDNQASMDRHVPYGYEPESSRSARDQPVSNRREDPMHTDLSKREAKSMKGPSQNNTSFNDMVNESKSGISAGEPSHDTVDYEPLDEAALIEQRRKRREAIKAKYRGSATPLLVQALQLGDKSVPGTPNKGQLVDDDTQSTRSGSPDISTPATPKESQDAASPSAFEITNDQDLANSNGNSNDIEEDGPSAADYDPTMDMREDQRRDDKRHNEEALSESYDETKAVHDQAVLLPAVAPVNGTTMKSRDEFDMFADDDDDDDMFAEDKPRNDNSRTTEDIAVAVPIPEAKELDIGMLDNWDDVEGYYKVILGELLNSRYHVQANLGRGMFSGVVRATDITTKKFVAIKLIRNNETMRKAGMKEIEILQKLNDADPEDKKHMIRLERHFEHKGHLCMVFENLSINLREVLKKFGRDVGINLKAVRAYAQQMFLGLSLMRKCNILHADLKPDNILVNESRNMLKVCDLGSASDALDNEITPYLVSRFYRAPEIILGMPYDFAIDIWSIGCTLYELYTGKILFTGRSNNQMLRSVMECRGKFTTKMLRRATFAHVHFDDMANFKSVEQDKLTGKDTTKILTFAKPTRDLRTRLLGASHGLTDAEMKELNLFADLLDKCLALNPEKRCTPAEALKHPFITRITK